MSDQREMTLDEYLESKLPDCHLARRQLQELRMERDALAAHVERLHGAILRPFVSCCTDQEAMEESRRIAMLAPTTSLARLIAAERADAMDWVLAQSIDENSEGVMWRNRIVQPEIDRLKHQAEGGE